MERRLRPIGPSRSRILFYFIFFCVRRKTVGATFTLYSSLIIVKSLQLRGRRKIAEPRKYCLVRVIVFLWRVFSLFFVSHRLGIWINSLHKYQ